jgi:type I restriction enzyme R subunit
VIATTSKLLTTGVDVQTCKLIVLDQRIESMPEFKQMIGRGTRINEDFDKYYFTILDFKKATELFADPAFDGEPVQIYEPAEGEPPVPPDEPGDDDTVAADEQDDGAGVDGGRRVKYVVNDVPVYVIAERVQYYAADGKLITESLKDYTGAAVRQQYASLDAFLTRWSKAAQKQAIIHELEEQGVLLGALAEQVGADYDPFDLVCHVAFDRPPLTRRERAARVRKRDYFAKYGEQARAVLDALLDKYADEGIENIESLDVLRVQPLNKLGTPIELIKRFGGRAQYLAALRELETALYAA